MRSLVFRCYQKLEIHFASFVSKIGRKCATYQLRRNRRIFTDTFSYIKMGLNYLIFSHFIEYFLIDHSKCIFHWREEKKTERHSTPCKFEPRVEKNRAIIELNVEGKMLPIKRKSGSSSWDGTWCNFLTIHLLNATSVPYVRPRANTTNRSTLLYRAKRHQRKPGTSVFK